MTHFKIIRADGVTEITKIKSFRYHIQNGNENVLRFGNAVANFIEFEYYGTSSDAIPIGEVISCYQTTNVGTDFSPYSGTRTGSIGLFNVTASTVKKGICKILAYDNIIKLDVDYSARLQSLENQFPMLCKDLLDDAATFAGVAHSVGAIGLINILNSTSVNYFYSNGITVRDLFSYASELLGMDLGINLSNEVAAIRGQYTTSGYSPLWEYSGEYIIAPTDTVQYPKPGVGEYIPVLYKQDGLEIAEDYTQIYDSVIIRKADGTTLYEHKPGGTSDRPYYIQGNPFIDYNTADSATLNVFLNVISGAILSHISNYKPFTARTFPFRCSYLNSGCATYIVDTDGSIIETPIMSIDWTDNEVVIKAFDYSSSEYSGVGIQNVSEKNATLEFYVNDLANAIASTRSIVGDGNLSGFTATDLTEAANELKTSVDAISGILANKNVLLIGDSISNPDYDSDPSWSNYFSTMLTDIGSTLTTVAYNGRGYVRQTGGYNFLTVMQTLTLSDYDVIIVFGGINDFAFDIPIGQLNLSTADAFDTNVNAVNALIKSSGALGVIISPIPSNNTRTDKLSLGFFGKALRSAAQRDGLLFVDGGAFPFLPVDGSGLIDSTHPLASVREPMARHIFDKILSGGDSQYSECDLIYAPNKTADVGSATYTMRLYFNGDSIFLQINGTVSTAGVVRINLPPFNVFLTDGFRGVVGTTAVNMQINAGNPGQFVINAANPAATGSFNVIREVASLSTQAFKTITY